MNIRNSYKTLELDYGASMEEVKKGYRNLVRVWHPDRFTEDPGLRKTAEEKLKQVNHAYGVLVAFFSPQTGAVNGTGFRRFPRWWHRAFWGMGLLGTLIRRNIIQTVRHPFSRMGLGWIGRALLNVDNEIADGYDPHRKGENSTRGGEMGGNMAGYRNPVDFRSVFDEVAREKRLKEKNMRPPHG